MENKMPLLGKINCLNLWKIVYHLQFPHFVILTQDATEEISFIHDRMPIMLDPTQPLPASFFANEDLADRQSHIQQWINPGTMPWVLDRVIDSAATDIVFEKC